MLSDKPTNVVALLGKVSHLLWLVNSYDLMRQYQAKIAYARRQYTQSLKTFQRVLQLNPTCLPDPRIGIGLCLWAMDHKAKAKAAWQRSVEVVGIFTIIEIPHDSSLKTEPRRVVCSAASGSRSFEREQEREPVRRGTTRRVSYWN